MEKVLFITGNKRSGTSQLVRILNLHPFLFISHESDIIWILYQFHNNKPIVPYPGDSPRGMELTLKQCGHMLDKKKSPAENYFAVQRAIMENGSPWLPAMKKNHLVWIGDKKPFQYSDPQLVSFILTMFPDTYFIHLVRHPFFVADSAERFNQTPHGDFWQNLTLEQAVERWTFHEKGVMNLKQRKGVNVLDVRYEDFCRNTKNELARIFEFLKIELDMKIIKTASRQTLYRMRNLPRISCGEETQKIMEQYGYKPEEGKRGLVRRLAVNGFWKLRKIF
ncbi:MAG TPA: sulfotransferase [Thermodesulfobacteriota bacterium]|nr:sulfotransferase [Thermodesulfobacteriota bacterium]